MAVAYDPIYDDLEAEFANDEVMGGTGEELAANRPGFFYAGPVAGESSARQSWNEQTPMEVPAPLDYSGNAYARQAALDFDRRKAQADAEREIEYAYKEANTAQQRKAIEMAVNYQKQQQARQLMDSGMSAPEAAMQSGLFSTGRDLLAYDKLQRPTMPVVQDFGEGIGKAIVTGSGQVRFPPVMANSPSGPVQGEPLLDPQTQEPVPNKLVVRSRNGGFHIIDTAPPRVPTTTARVQLPGPDALTPGPTLSGPVENMARYGVTNFSNLNPASAPTSGQTQEIIRVTKDGRRVVYDAVTKKPLRYAEP